MEIYTKQIRNLQDLNQEIRQRLSSMHLSTEQEMKNLAKWLEEKETMVSDFENVFLPICHHLKLLREEFEKLQEEDS